MLSGLVVCAVLSLALGGNVPDATNNREFQQWEGRIVGGTTAILGQFAYTTSLRSANNAHFCGGFVLSNRWIGTAAHCTVPRSANNIRAVVGTIHRLTGGTTHTVSRIVNHPQYNAGTLANDIALVQTSNTIVFSNLVQPVALSSRHVGGGVNAVATGWGQTSRNGPTATGLQWITLRTITNDECKGKFSRSNAARIFDNTICTFTRAGQGTCMGDSGGPLVAAGNVIGAVSWGIPCANGSPDVYSRISSHRSWMMSVMT